MSIAAQQHRTPGPTATRRRAKAAKDGRYARTIRAQVAERDGWCRVRRDGWTDAILMVFGACNGASEWAHLGDKKRFKTRGLPPEERHTTAGSLMLCEKHHDAYDEGRLTILGDDANGTLEFRIR